MAANNRSQVYLDANDNISKVINQISASVNDLNASLARVGSVSNGSFSNFEGIVEGFAPEKIVKNFNNNINLT